MRYENGIEIRQQMENPFDVNCTNNGTIEVVRYSDWKKTYDYMNKVSADRITRALAYFNHRKNEYFETYSMSAETSRKVRKKKEQCERIIETLEKRLKKLTDYLETL